MSSRANAGATARDATRTKVVIPDTSNATLKSSKLDRSCVNTIVLTSQIARRIERSELDHRPQLTNR
jgi:hypothetical protein